MHTKSLSQLRDDLHAKKYTSEELTRAMIERIKAHNDSLNCFITITEEHALQAAKAADEQIQAGKAGALTGIPIAHKDIFCTQGIKTSCASKMLDNFIAPYDATVVTLLNNAGTVLLGKTNMDEFAMGSSNENSFYGNVKNPWDITRVPGGSSGGSAAAVAAHLVPAATGTDTGGSIRQPASLCNLTGLKPTYGRVSRYGMIAFASSLDQAGPLTHTAEDAAMMLNAMAGFDPNDSTCVDETVPDYTQDLNNSLKGLRIGIVKEFSSGALDDNIASRINDCAKALENAGAELIDIQLPNLHLSVPAYYVIAPAEASSNLARYDGVRYGYRCEEPQNLTDLYERSRAEAFGDEVKRRIMIGTYALSSGYYDAYYLQAQKVRHLIRDDFLKAFEKVDVILGPTSPCLPFKIGEKSDDPLSMYLSDIYTIAVNLAGLPAISFPAGFVNDLPVGAHLIGSYFKESQLLNVVHQYQQMTDWHQRIPSQYV